MNEPCPLCAHPIQDTAYVCGKCVRKLQAALRAAAQEWDDLTAIAHREIRPAAEGVARTKKPLEAVYGPDCPDPCEHTSCDAYRVYRWRLHTGREPQPAREAAAPIVLTLLNEQWAVNNTVTTWSRHVSEERGIPVTKTANRPKGAAITLHPTLQPSHPARCEYSDLPRTWCACGHHPPQETA